jgi:hypothetical protein
MHLRFPHRNHHHFRALAPLTRVFYTFVAADVQSALISLRKKRADCTSAATLCW